MVNGKDKQWKDELRLGQHMYGYGVLDSTIGDDDTTAGYKMSEGRFDQQLFDEVLAVVRSNGVTKWVKVRRESEEPDLRQRRRARTTTRRRPAEGKSRDVTGAGATA